MWWGWPGSALETVLLWGWGLQGAVDMLLEWGISAKYLIPWVSCVIPQGHPGTKPQLGNVSGERRVLRVGAEGARGEGG